MILDNQTNFLYIADTLANKYPIFYEQFKSILSKAAINYAFLQNTKDASKRFIRFVYNPIYLQRPKYLKTISDVDSICEKLGIETIKSNILIDGGNIIKAKDKVIMTERIFKENPAKKRKELIKELEEILEIDKIIIIPTEPYDVTGHADGMVRFLNDDTLLINDYSLHESQNFINAFHRALKGTGLNCITIPCPYKYNPKNKGQVRGYYINYLQMGKTVIVPTFEKKEDDIVVRQFEQLFEGHQVGIVNCNDIADEGGVLNCISWNIQV